MDWFVVLLAVALPALIAVLLPRSNPRRLLVLAVAAFFVVRYLIWRLGVFPYALALQEPRGWWWLAVLVVELVVLLEVALLFLSIAWLRDNRDEAFAAENRLRQLWYEEGDAGLPSVDIVISTHQEGPQVVQKAILGATLVDYPRRRVLVLDHGGRDWLRSFCEQAGATYVPAGGPGPAGASGSSRGQAGSGAAAGPLPLALRHGSGDLLLLLDADVIPLRHVLWRLVGLFDDPSLASVQTSQAYFNPEAIQYSISVGERWSDEQGFFFRKISPGRDALGAAFSCGSGSIHRRAALADCTLPTADIHLSVDLVRRGWRTTVLAEALSMGLAPDSLDTFFVKRRRWAQGNLQLGWLLPRLRGLTWLQQLLFLPLPWLVQYRSRLFLQLLPLVALLAGVAPLPALPAEALLSHQLPALLALGSCMLVLAEGYYLPLFSEASQLFMSFQWLHEGWQSLRRRRTRPGAPAAAAAAGNGNGSGNGGGHGGGSGDGGRSGPGGGLFGVALYGQTLIPAYLLFGFNVVLLLRLALAIGQSLPGDQALLLSYGLAWGTANAAMLITCIMLSLERRQRRQEPRITIERPAALLLPSGERLEGTLVDLSMSGGRLRLAARPSADGGTLEIPVGPTPAAAIHLPLNRVWQNPAGQTVLTFSPLNIVEARALVGYTFSGDFLPQEQELPVNFNQTLRQLLRPRAAG